MRHSLTRPSENRQLLDSIRWFLLIISILTVVILILIYLQFPPSDSSARWHKLLIEIIPNAVVAVLVIPAAYVFLYKHGLTLEQQLEVFSNQTLRYAEEHTDQLESIRNNTGLQPNPEITNTVIQSAETRDIFGGQRKTNVLLVIDMQNDFLFEERDLGVTNGETLVRCMNDALQYAHINGWVTIFTRDWHPKNHKQFDDFSEHCVENSEGAQLHENLHLPEHRLIVDFGVDPLKEGFSPFENHALGLFLSSDAVEGIYIAGVALEYCVVEACLSAVKTDKEVFALKPLIADTGRPNEPARIWKILEADKNISVLDSLPDDLKKHLQSD